MEKNKIIDLIISGDLSLAIELCKGLGLDIVEILAKFISSEFHKQSILGSTYLKIEISGYYIRRDEITGGYWFADHVNQGNTTEGGVYDDYEDINLFTQAIIKYHNEYR